MGKIKIQESTINLTQGRTAKIAVLIYVGEEDPVVALDKARDEYVGLESYNEFIDYNMDNPWYRVIISEINEMNQVDFDPLVHKLKS